MRFRLASKSMTLDDLELLSLNSALLRFWGEPMFVVLWLWRMQVRGDLVSCVLYTNCCRALIFALAMPFFLLHLSLWFNFRHRNCSADRTFNSSCWMLNVIVGCCGKFSIISLDTRNSAVELTVNTGCRKLLWTWNPTVPTVGLIITTLMICSLRPSVWLLSVDMSTFHPHHSLWCYTQSLCCFIARPGDFCGCLVAAFK